MKTRGFKSMVLPVLLFLACVVSSCQGAVVDVNDLFQVGEYQDIEVAIPKRGYLGAPWFPGSSLYGPKTVPMWDKDFSKRYVRVRVLDIRKVKTCTRVWLRLDEIDANGIVLTTHYPDRKVHPRYLYYAALDVGPGGPRLSAHRRDPNTFKDSQGNEVEITGHIICSGTSFEVPFPLTLSLPPVLSPDRSLRETNWMSGYLGAAYIESAKLKDGRRIKAVLFKECKPDMKVKDEDVRYYSNDKKELSSEAGPDSVKVVITDAETQFWADPNDWLWQTMERTDDKGHLTMRCKQIKTPYKPDDKPAD